MGANSKLWQEYRATWEIFSSRLDELQAIVELKDRGRAEAALLAVEKARVAHNMARDRVAAELSGEIAAQDAKNRDLAEQRRVRHTAQLLWEIAGKPSGTAESDWHCAEQLVKAASAE
jgi:hypothetical protein